MRDDAPTSGYIALLAAVVERARRDARGECWSTATPGQRPMVMHEAQTFLAWARDELEPMAAAAEEHNRRIRRIA